MLYHLRLGSAVGLALCLSLSAPIAAAPSSAVPPVSLPAGSPAPARLVHGSGLVVSQYRQLLSTSYAAHEGLPAGSITAIELVGGHVYAGAAAARFRFNGAGWEPSPAPAVEPAANAVGLPAGAVVTSRATAAGGDVWLVTSRGAFREHEGRTTPLDLPRAYRFHQPVPDVDTEIRAAATGGDGRAWLATNFGPIVTDGADWWRPFTREDGVPFEDMTCIAASPNGDIWGGTTSGAWRLRAGEFRYFWGRRWLPGNHVNAIACAADGAAWLATDGGVARIEETPMTLAAKAIHYESITEERHDRGGWVTSCGLKTPGDPAGGIIPEASDNDGLWTAIYVAAQAFRFGTTADPKAHERGHRSLEALLDLVRLSGYPGFPARALIRKDETVSGYDPDETVRVDGETNKIWYASPAEAGLLCKGDTSSDELDGHYFAWYAYYEHAADSHEKEEIRQVCRAVTDNLLQHQFTLVGHTGRKTRWGVFGPQFINDDPRWWEERGLNSIELLCYLKVAAHICGDARFARAYDDLVDRHHYLLNTLGYRSHLAWWNINHSDDELAFLVYYPLTELEQDPHRKGLLLDSLAASWQGLRDEHGPFFDFIYGAVSGQPCDSENAVQTLQDWPWDLVNWDVRNSQRHDITLRTDRGILRNEIDRVLPASERPLGRWATNPYDADGGSAGEEEDGSAWLLPYWMGRFYHLVEERA